MVIQWITLYFFVIEERRPICIPFLNSRIFLLVCSSLDRLSLEVIKLLLNDHGLNKPHCTCLKPLMDIFTTIGKTGTMISTDLKKVVV